ncbi:MAG: helix-turn-helix transcriptional regulator [Bacillota bacterium]
MELDYNKNFIERFNQMANKSVNAIAKDIGINQQTLYRYLSGEHKLSIEVAIKVATYFDCSVDYLIGLENDFGEITQNKNTQKLRTATTEEEDLIKSYRSLEHNKKAKLIGYAEGLKD